MTANELAPPECASLNLTSVVTGAGTFSGTIGSDLILASAGNDAISDPGGTANCVVGGAGTDSITMSRGGTNLCIVSTATKATAVKNCTIVARRP